MFGLNFKVQRERYSVTQGEAVVYLNNHEIARFQDQIELIEGVWQSVKSDEAFINGVLSHPFEDLYHVSKPLKDYLIKTHNIQKVSKETISELFEHYLNYAESDSPQAINQASEGLFYTKSGDRFISFKNIKGDCQAEDFSNEAHALCWLASAS